jgi:hypothetical protein
MKPQHTGAIDGGRDGVRGISPYAADRSESLERKILPISHEPERPPPRGARVPKANSGTPRDWIGCPSVDRTVSVGSGRILHVRPGPASTRAPEHDRTLSASSSIRVRRHAEDKDTREPPDSSAHAGRAGILATAKPAGRAALRKHSGPISITARRIPRPVRSSALALQSRNYGSVHVPSPPSRT